MAKGKRIAVILDTDIGTDIDDTWALAMLLKSPELDTRLVVGATGNTTYRASLIARLLETAGRTDIPVAVGIHQDRTFGEAQRPWVEDYDLARYPGTVEYDGVQTLVRTIMDSPEDITLIGIGPVTNIAAALDVEPKIASRCRFVGMLGSIRRHHENKEGAIAEYNVAQDIPACQKVFAAPWKSLTITPLDTCGSVRLEGDAYAALCDCPDPLIKAVIENYRIWLGGKPDGGRTSILFDTVAIYLAFATELLVMETMSIRIADSGYMVSDTGGPGVQVAMDWKDPAKYRDFLTRRLLG